MNNYDQYKPVGQSSLNSELNAEFNRRRDEWRAAQATAKQVKQAETERARWSYCPHCGEKLR